MSRDMVQVVLRKSTSTSPDCSAVKRSDAVSGVNSHRLRVVEDRRGERAAIVDVEADPVVGRLVERAEARRAGVDAALQMTAGLHVVERGGRAGGRGEAERRADDNRQNGFDHVLLTSLFNPLLADGSFGSTG